MSRHSKKTYEKEGQLARQLAKSEPVRDAAACLAEAITSSDEHEIILDGKTVTLEYANEFGPTCTVDDVLERMTLADYREACEETVRLLLQRICLYTVKLYAKKWPTVTFVPEPDSPIINRVKLTFTVPPETYTLLLDALAARDKEVKR